MNNCFFLKPTRQPTCFICTGRYGDMMIVLPALKHLYDKTGIKQVFCTSLEFSSLLEGVSYVVPWAVNVPWISGSPFCKYSAEKYFNKVVIPDWWHCPGVYPPRPIEQPGLIYLTYQGRRIAVTATEWESYMTSIWYALGFTRQQLIDFPLVFDRRNAEREEVLIKQLINAKKPTVLYNFSGITNPMPAVPEVVNALKPLSDRIALVDMGDVRAHRIFDLLGPYDKALCVMTGDTATLHLASASKVPLVALVADGGKGSIVKGNCILKLRYKDVPAQADSIRFAIERLLK